MPISGDKLSGAATCLEEHVRFWRGLPGRTGIHRLIVLALAALFIADGAICAALCARQIVPAHEAATAHAENCHAGQGRKSPSDHDHAKRDSCMSCSMVYVGGAPDGPILVNLTVGHPAAVIPSALAKPFERPVAELPRGPPASSSDPRLS